MAVYYLSEKNINDSITYFKDTEFNGEIALSYYLGFRHLGLSMRQSIIIGSTKMTPEYKEDYVDTWNKMFSLLDPSETAEKILGISPFKLKDEIKSGDLFNPGTPLTVTGIASRPKDSLKNLVRTIDFVEYEDDYIKATRKTPEVINERCLSEKKISLKSFAGWFFRFYGFNFEDDLLVSNNDFGRVVKKTMINYFKLSKNDFNWLFEDDILNDTFQATKTRITGDWLRGRFIFNDNIKLNKDTIRSVSEGGSLIDQKFEMLDKNLVSEYLKLIGDNPSDDTIINTLLLKKQIVLTGVPGTGKSRFLDSIKNKFDEYEMIQFHANYSYEDFIGGETLVNGTIESRIGIFLAFCQKAEQFINKKFLFIIDELNRGNVAQIFGETILTLDRGYLVTLAKPITIKEGKEEKIIYSFQIPDNVYIAASMNTADRNIAFLDLAIRRRFAFIEIYPNYEFVSASVEYHDYDLGNTLKIINNSIMNTLNKEEFLIGHSYFLSDTVYDEELKKYKWSDEKFQMQFNYVILPTLKEYTFSDKNALITILGNELSTGILNMEEFIQAFEEKFKNN